MRARTTCTHPKMRQIPNAKPPLAVVNKDVLYIMIDYYLDRCVGNFKGQMSPPYAYFQSQMTALTRRPLKCLCVWFIVSFHNSTLAGSEAYSERGLRGGPFLSSSLLWPHSQTPPTSEQKFEGFGIDPAKCWARNICNLWSMSFIGKTMVRGWRLAQTVHRLMRGDHRTAETHVRPCELHTLFKLLRTLRKDSCLKKKN